ncbi:inorganic diphosphatase [Photobacterium damselae]|uniref:inorganic diphosphatase n=1 Tax=Photobacterium damselae TaxID=38293 RepID=UPI002234A108|nr:inorganic diphosphatase [Photobacterium damselae]
MLGPAQPRGSVAQVKVIGGLQMLDDGEQDDKLIAISLADSSSFNEISTIEQLQHAFPGVIDIVKIWFSHYKGTEGNIEIKEIMDSKQANTVLKQAMAHYQKSNQSS